MRAVRTVVGVVGELAITAGVVLLLFVVWEIGVVGVTASRDQADAVTDLERQFSAPHPGSGTATGGTSPQPSPKSSNPGAANPQTPFDGSAFAILRIPRLGAGWAKPVYEGVSLPVLAKGLGHYPQTSLPGQVGNIAIAGHRAGHGNPLIDIDAIQVGDLLILETQDAYDVYRVVRHQIVAPTHTEVLLPVPDQPGATPTEALFTLTSCEPRYGSTNRYIVTAQLDRAIPHEQGLPADLLAEPGGNA